MKKRTVIVILCILMLINISACSTGTPVDNPVEDKDGIMTITDCIGREVQLNGYPERIATLDPFAGQAVIMLGYGDRMPATVNGVKRDLLLQEICPSLKEAKVVKDSGAMNAEAVLALGIDLIFVKSDMYFNNEAERDKLEKTGIPYLVIDYNSIEEQYKAFMVIGEALGETEEAQAMVDYYKNAIERVEKVVEKIPQEERPSLYHSVNEALRTDIEGSLEAEWIGITGVENVSLEDDLFLKKRKTYTTLEQVFVWDPDIIICNESGVNDYILQDPQWSGLRAVREGNVYQIPIGVSRWGHPSSTETSLAILWLAKLLYPDYFEDLDIREEMRDYYYTFYDFKVSEETLDKILSGKGILAPN